MKVNIKQMAQAVSMKLGPKVGRAGLVLSKHAPEILLGAGVVGVVTSTVMACKATLKVNAVIEQANVEMFDKIRKASETLDKETYSEDDAKRDLTIAYIQRTLKIAKLYVPAATVGAISIGCILGSNGIMRKRNLALIAAYKVVEEGFESYRKRVVEEYGEEADRMFHRGIRADEIIEKTTDKKGKEVESVKTIETHDPNHTSPYQVWYGPETSVQWRNNRSENEFFLNSAQLYANDMLRSRGHIFLNEVYDILGIKRTKAGSVVGWVYDNEKGDNFIDIGYRHPANAPRHDDIYGFNPPFQLDFNVDGIIIDLI